MVYEPDNSIKKGYVLIFREIYREIIDNRWLTYQLFKRDFFATYKQSFFGIFWAILLPIISVGTFIVLSRAGIFSIGEIQIPYPIFAILGMAFWQIFSAGIIGSSGALVKAGSMSTPNQFFKKIIGLCCCRAVNRILHRPICPGMYFFLLFMVLHKLAVFGSIGDNPNNSSHAGFGMLLSLLNGIMRDVGNVVSLVMTFLMFLTPILYVKPSKGILMEITKFNPLYYLISESRNLILSGNILEANGFAISAGVSVMIFIISLVGFHLTETRISERV